MGVAARACDNTHADEACHFLVHYSEGDYVHAQ